MACIESKASEGFLLPNSLKFFKNSQLVSKEIENVISSYANTKIISNAQNLEILVLPYKSLNVYLRVHLQAEYPEVLPEISVTSDCLTKTETLYLHQLLMAKAEASLGQPMLLALINEACQYVSRTKQASSILTDAERSAKHKMKKKVARNVSNLACKVLRKNKEGVFLSDCKDSTTEMVASQLSSSCSSSIIHTKRPTHFIALRITDDIILQNLIKIQNQLVRQEPLLSKGVFAKEIFHLTLCSLGLDTDDDIVKCIETLEQVKSDLQDCLPLNPLTVQGMSQFYNRAVYAKVRPDDGFTNFCKLLRDGLEKSGIEIRDEHDGFTPHVTIVKVRRPERKLFGSRNIEPAIYSHVQDTVLGEQSVDSLFLCSMDGQRGANGFYVTLHEMRFR